jgi:choline dehydrogenase
MQIHWFDASGASEEGRSQARRRAAVMRVYSTGEVRLRSDDPLDDPIVDLYSLSDRRDLVRLRDAVRRMVAIVQRPSVRAVCEQVVVPGGTLEQLDRDEAIDEWLSSTVGATSQLTTVAIDERFVPRRRS